MGVSRKKKSKRGKIFRGFFDKTLKVRKMGVWGQNPQSSGAKESEGGTTSTWRFIYLFFQKNNAF